MEKEWSKGEIKALKAGLKTHPSDAFTDRNDRFRIIAALVSTEGGGRTRTECYAKYKELKAAQKEKNKDAASLRSENDYLVASGDGVGNGRKASRENFMTNPPVSGLSPYPHTHAAAVLPDKPKLTGWGREAVRSRGSVCTVDSVETEPGAHALVEDVVTSAELQKGFNGLQIGGSASRRGSDIAMEVEEMEDFDTSFAEEDTPLARRAVTSTKTNITNTSAAVSSKPDPTPTHITQEQALKLRSLVFGDPKKSFPVSWSKQGLTFGGSPAPGYGMVQHEGGPCGPLAVVQARVLQALMRDALETWRSPSRQQTQKAMLWAITQTLWEIGVEKGRCIVALCGATSSVPSTTSYKPDGFTEKLLLYELQGRDRLEGFLTNHLSEFTKKGGMGVVLLVYSAMLTRGLEQVRGDVDEGMGEGPGGAATLMGRHGYASQEMVNLLLTGEAHSNTFDGEKRVGDGTDAMILRGTSRRGDIGFLALFEAYGHVAVGSNLKNPRTPVWVVCSESHYSVLFSPDKGLVGGDYDKFDLFYFDQLGRQEGEIRLSINTEPSKPPPVVNSETDLIPPIDMVIRTNWPGSSVDWNGTDPIL